MDKKQLLLLSSGIIIGCIIGILISAFVAITFYLPEPSNEISEEESPEQETIMGVCDSKIITCREKINFYQNGSLTCNMDLNQCLIWLGNCMGTQGAALGRPNSDTEEEGGSEEIDGEECNGEVKKCVDQLGLIVNEYFECNETLTTCLDDVALCMGRDRAFLQKLVESERDTTTVPVTTISTSSSSNKGYGATTQNSPQQESITADRVKNFVNRLNGIGSLSSDALFILDITDVGKYTVRKTSSGIQVSKGGSSSKDIVIRMSRYHFEMLESSSNLCGKARELYDEEPPGVWDEERNVQKLCSKGYIDLYYQCFSGDWVERQVIGFAC